MFGITIVIAFYKQFAPLDMQSTTKIFLKKVIAKPIRLQSFERMTCDLI